MSLSMGPRILLKGGKKGAYLYAAHFDGPMALAIAEAARTAPALRLNTLGITEGYRSEEDRAPERRGKHPELAAIDIRCLDPQHRRLGSVADDSEATGIAWADRIRDALPSGYDVVFEGNHIHIEWDPKPGEGAQREIQMANNTSDTKPFWHSRTMWVNGFVGLNMLLNMVGVGFQVDADTQAAVLVIVNVILRAVTKGAVSIG